MPANSSQQLFAFGTPFKALIASVRSNLLEPQPGFWADDEIMEYLRNGCKSLWRAIIDLHANHFSVIDNTSMFIPASSATGGTSSTVQSADPNANYVVGVPPDLFRVLMIEPKDLQQSSQTRGVTFQPRKYNTLEFQGARGLDAKDPGNYPIVFYDVVLAGPPTGAPSIVFAPQLLSQLNLNVQYVPSLPKLTIQDSNPIPGESDQALVNWATAYAFGKQPEPGKGVGAPNADWLSAYRAEEGRLLTALTPRQEQEPEIVEGIFDYY